MQAHPHQTLGRLMSSGGIPPDYLECHGIRQYSQKAAGLVVKSQFYLSQDCLHKLQKNYASQSHYWITGLVMQKISPTIYRVPIDATRQKQNLVIGVVDASGSMDSFWVEMVRFWNTSIAPIAKVCITFSNSARLEKSPVLSQKLKDHGGGATNILAAFEMLETYLKEFDLQTGFTVVFISDGKDTFHNTCLPAKIQTILKGSSGRNINFICLGVQSGFPTTVAMSLRQKYHTGSETIPAVYLIEYASEKAFFNKFETMKNCFTSANKVLIKPGALSYPWEGKDSHSFCEGVWVLFPNEVRQVSISRNQHEQIRLVPSLKSLSIDDLADCFRGWVQKIQLLQVQTTNSKTNVTQIAQATLNTILGIVKRYQTENDINILSNKENSLKTFKSRAIDFIVRNLGVRIKWFVQELTVIIKGVGAQQLSEYQAAKRIAIGTITGKYHQKALALKGITPEDFAVIKEEFKNIYRNVVLSQEPSPQEPSIFTLQNQKEVFQQPDFIEGLDLCKTQYDLVESFPVIGYSLKVKRYDGSMVNPWKVIVNKLARHHSSIDSMYLANNHNKFQLNVGDGVIQEINAVLPLFTLKDKELTPFLNSNLFKLAISFMVVQNIDTYYPQAYFALLGSTYIYLLTVEKNEWRDNLIRSIFQSIKVTYGQEQSFKQKTSSIEDDPLKLFASDNEYKEEHVDISKVLIYVFYIAREGRLSKDKVRHLADLAVCHYAEKTFVQHEFRLSKFIHIGLDKFKLPGEIPTNEFQNFKELNAFCKSQIKKGLLDENNVKLSAKNFVKENSSEKQRVNFAHIQEFYSSVTGESLQEQDVFLYFAHYLQGKTPDNYSKPVKRDQQLAKKVILKKFDFDTEFKDENYITKHLKTVKDHYVDQFRDTHFDIMPMTKSHLLKLCDQKNIDPTTLILNQASGLLTNACQSPHCHFYLKPLKSGIIEHMRLWKRKLPNQFHIKIKSHLNLKDPVLIYEKLDATLDFKRFNKDKQFVVKYIQDVLNALGEQ